MAPPLNLLPHLAQQLGKRCRLLVALSGGLDSMALLHALVALRNSSSPFFQLRAIHIHHGLSANADLWHQHCRHWCDHWQVSLEVVYVHVDPQGEGVEAAARAVRYQALAEHLQQGETLVTAQHLDDQCETLLLALKRGSGPTGLAAMADCKPFSNGELLRPLLSVSRQQLEQYARIEGISWIEDDSNQNDRFDRNFLRLHILPRLKQRWPHFAIAAARSAKLCAEQEQLLDELLSERLTLLMNKDGALEIEGLRVVSEVQRNALLRRWIAAVGGLMPGRGQLQRLWHEVALSREDAEPQLQWGDRQVRRYQRQLYLLPQMQSVIDWQSCWDGSSSLELPDNLGQICLAPGGINLRAPRDDEVVSVRFSAQGSIRIVGRRHAQTVKKIWQELKIPPWQRERTPLLYFNEQLVAALGVFVTWEGQAVEGNPVWQVQWLRDRSSS